MTKTYKAPQAFEDGTPLPIPMEPVESRQVRAIGYDAETKTLAVTFNYGAGAIYQYPDVEPEVFEAFKAAESKGAFFGQHIKALPFRKYRGEPLPVADAAQAKTTGAAA
jgi:hypothetical protein